MNLTEDVAVVQWPETHYVFVEKVGPFRQTAPQAWGEAHSYLLAIAAKNEITKYMSLYKTGPLVYRAGFAIAAPPVDLPAGVAYEKFAGGEYVRFVLTGPYTDLPQATGKAWDAVAAKKIALRDDFAIENYTKDPRITPADQLVTEILIPKA
jgi:predicted transcriptional regulator YdeE